MKFNNVILVPFGKPNFEAIESLWCSGQNAKMIANDSGYSETVIRMILKRVLGKTAPISQGK